MAAGEVVLSLDVGAGGLATKRNRNSAQCNPPSYLRRHFAVPDPASLCVCVFVCLTSSRSSMTHQCTYTDLERDCSPMIRGAQRFVLLRFEYVDGKNWDCSAW